jgi:hypothetical protein
MSTQNNRSYKIFGKRSPSGSFFQAEMTGEEARQKIDEHWADGDFPTIPGIGEWSAKKLVTFWAEEVMELREIEIERA